MIPKRYKNPKNNPCKFGIICDFIAQDACRYEHPPGDVQKARQYKEIINRKNQLVIVYKLNDSPFILTGELLRLELYSHIELKEMHFYQAGDLKFQLKKNKLSAKVLRVLGPFQNFQIEMQILQKQYTTHKKIFRKHQKIDTPDTGEIIINDKGYKVLRSYALEKNRLYLERVNESMNHRLLDGVTVFFKQNNRGINISEIIYPKFNIFSGILEVTKDYELRFVTRNVKIDNMIVQSIDEDVQNQLGVNINFKKYSFLFKQEFKDNLLAEINSKLKKNLVLGKFLEWPIQSKLPLIKICKLMQNNIRNVKKAILQQFNLTIENFTPKEKKLAQKIISNFNIKTFKRPIFNEQENAPVIFTLDGSNTRCRDDAISISAIPNSQDSKIHIHISDVAQLIAKNDEIDKQCNRRDSTLYIKNYHIPMMTEELSNDFFSLNKGPMKLLYTMSFNVNKQGLINLKTVHMEKTMGQIAENYRYEDINKINKQIIPIDKLLEMTSSRQKLREVDFFDNMTASEKLIEQLMVSSCEILNFTFEKNLKRMSKIKQECVKVANKHITDELQIIKTIDQKLKEFKKIKTKLAKIQRQKSNKSSAFEKLIDKKVNQQFVQAIDATQLKSSIENVKTEKIKKQKNKNKAEEQDQQQLSSESLSTVSESELISDHQLQNSNINQENIQEKQEKEKNQETQHLKKLIKQVQEEQQLNILSEQSSDQSDDEGIRLVDEKNRQKRAEGAKNFLQSIFNHFKIEIGWKSITEIKNTFDTISKLKKGQLFKKYIQLIKILNYQYFKYLVPKKQIKKSITNTEKQKQKQKQEDDTLKKQKQQKPIIINLQKKKSSKKQEKKEEKPKKYKLVNIQQQKQSKYQQKKIPKLFKQIKQQFKESMQVELADQKRIVKFVKIQQQKQEVKQNNLVLKQQKKLKKKLDNLRKKEIKQIKNQIRQKIKTQMLKIFEQQNQSLLESFKTQTVLYNTAKEEIQKMLQNRLQFFNFIQDIKKLDVLQKYKSIENIQNIYKDFAKAINSKLSFKTKIDLKRKEFSPIITQIIQQSLNTNQPTDLKQQNEESIEFYENISKQERLKWTNPIREYYSLICLRFIKQYEWIFQGDISPQTILSHFKQLKQIEKQKKKLIKWNQKRIENAENNSKVKQINREIEKLQFYEKVKKKPNIEYIFLVIKNRKSKSNQNTQNNQIQNVNEKVFHQILGEVYIQNEDSKIPLYEEAKGKVLIKSDFPIKIQIQLSQK